MISLINQHIAKEVSKYTNIAALEEGRFEI